MSVRNTRRMEARAAGRVKYFSGKSCKHGHRARRYTSNGLCTVCAQIVNKRNDHRVRAHPVFGPRLRKKQREQNAAWRKANPKRARYLARKNSRKHRALNPQRHQEYRWRYNGVGFPTRPRSSKCECCSTDTARRIVLDHCHKTGLFRGWICDDCNMGLGRLGDNVSSLLVVIKYLRKSERQVPRG